MKSEKKDIKFFASRKYVLTLLIFFAGTILCGLPPALSMFVFAYKTPLIILSGSEWVTVITMLCGFYFGANVAQKKLLNKTEIIDKNLQDSKLENNEEKE